MKRKSILYKVFHPSTPVLLALCFIATALFLFFQVGKSGSTWIRIAAYTFATYVAVTLILSVQPVVQKVKALMRERMGSTLPEVNTVRRLTLTMTGSLLLNLAFAVFKAVTAVIHHSAWLGTMAFYYIMLSVERFLLLRVLTGDDERMRTDWKPYTRCGILLLAINIVLAGVSILATRNAGSVSYQGYLIYAMAAYTFYAIITAIHNLLKYRKMKIPTVSACKAVSLVTALVSVYSLQTAMLTTFGHDSAFITRMNAITGSSVIVIVTIISIGMIIIGRRSA